MWLPYPTSWWASLVYIFKSKNSPAGIENFLRGSFKDMRLREALTHVVITSYDTRSAQPHIFDSKKAKARPENYDVFMRDAARATSAAPVYLPAAQVPFSSCDKSEDCAQTTRYLIDGGVIANTPSLIGYQAALEVNRAQGASPTDVILVSLGTGDGRISITSNDNAGVKEWVPLLLGQVMMFGNSQVLNSFFISLLGDQYFRIDPQIPQNMYQLDDGTIVPGLIELTEKFLSRPDINRRVDAIARAICSVKSCPFDSPIMAAVRQKKSARNQKDVHEVRKKKMEDMIGAARKEAAFNHLFRPGMDRGQGEEMGRAH